MEFAANCANCDEIKGCFDFFGCKHKWCYDCYQILNECKRVDITIPSNFCESGQLGPPAKRQRTSSGYAHIKQIMTINRSFCPACNEAAVCEISNCRYCDKPFPVKYLLMSHEEKCGDTVTKCIKCSLDIYWRDIPFHRCKSLHIDCFMCDVDIPAEVYESHKIRCEKTATQCKRCLATLHRERLYRHDCYRTIECFMCTTHVPYQAFDYHVNWCRTRFFRCKSCHFVVRNYCRLFHRCELQDGKVVVARMDRDLLNRCHRGTLKVVDFINKELNQFKVNYEEYFFRFEAQYEFRVHEYDFIEASFSINPFGRRYELFREVHNNTAIGLPLPFLDSTDSSSSEDNL